MSTWFNYQLLSFLKSNFVLTFHGFEVSLPLSSQLSSATSLVFKSIIYSTMISLTVFALSLLTAASAASHCSPSVAAHADLSKKWDYIVAGGGPSGVIVSQRLAEQHYNVLLLEGGGPSVASTGGTVAPTWNATGLTIYDIASQDGAIFTTGVEQTCTDTAGLAGCLLGGGVEINALVFIPPAAHDFDDNWPEGWKWSDIKG